MTAEGASARLKCLTTAQKNELLFGFGVNFNNLPNWQKRGVGLYWEEYEKTGHDPRSGLDVKARRRRIKTDYDLPMKGAHILTSSAPCLKTRYRNSDRRVKALTNPEPPHTSRFDEMIWRGPIKADFGCAS